MYNPQPLSVKYYLLMLVLFICFSAYTLLHCLYLTDWIIENILVFFFVIALSWQIIVNQLPLTPIALLCVFIYLTLHQSGAQYAYSNHPFGYYMQHTMHLQRNGYDRLVHFCFGFLLYLPAYEYCSYKQLHSNGTLKMYLLERVLAAAALFELIEFAVAVYIFPDKNGETYVGTQGDVWDAQKDIALAVIGGAITIGLIKLKEAVTTYNIRQHNIIRLKPKMQ
jgi:putative membrane protein